jgi:hypothetical protein
MHLNAARAASILLMRQAVFLTLLEYHNLLERGRARPALHLLRQALAALVVQPEQHDFMLTMGRGEQYDRHRCAGAMRLEES